MRYDSKGKWICTCSCSPDKEISVHGISLRRGLKTHCGCKRTYRLKETIEFPKEYINKTKTCSSCAKEKEYKDFYFKEYINPKGNKTYQFSARCIQCDIEAVQQERADNPEWIIGYNQQRYQDKKDDYFRKRGTESYLHIDQYRRT